MPRRNETLFSKLTKLFRSGPVVKRKIRSTDTSVALPDKEGSSGAMLFQRSQNSTYSSITASAYNMSERLARYQDFTEMEYTPEIASALDLYADESCSSDDKGRSLHIYSDNEKIKDLLDDLFYNTINIGFNLRPWIRNLVKYGDFFLYNDVHPEFGIVSAFPIPVNEIEREEGFDPDDPFAIRYRWVSLGNKTLENWEVTHFRLLGNDMFLPYGSSIIEAARRIWRQLILIEDAMLVYRVVRAPERRVFSIEVGNIDPDDVPLYIEAQKKALKSSQVLDPTTGRVDLRYNPMPLHWATSVPLLDGSIMNLREISSKMEEDPSWVPWVHSVSDEDGTPVPGKVIWCGKNYDAEKLIKVFFDCDTGYVFAAPEHPFLLAGNGNSYVEAQDLRYGDKVLGAEFNDLLSLYFPDKTDQNEIFYNVVYTEVVELVKNVESGEYDENEDPILIVEGNTEEVYCMTVVGPEDEDDRHNFAVLTSNQQTPAIVYVRNSTEEDYFIPVRGSDSGTKIETLAGGQNTAAIEDVAYIQKKLFAALKVPRAYLGYDEALSCVVPETKVDLLDGRSLTLEEIKEELDRGLSPWVYSIDCDSGGLTPGKIIWCGPTRKNADLVRVTLDNGETFDTTPDHKWMLRDGSWCEAGLLESGASLMPLYKSEKGDQVYDPKSDSWKSIRLLNYEAGIYDEINNEKNAVLIHNVITWCLLNKPTTKNQIIEGLELTNEQFDELLKVNKLSYDEFSKSYMLHSFNELRSHVFNVVEGSLNHSVVSVEPLELKRDTWCMEVAGTHNFGLTEGAIISNSKATLAQEDIRFSRTITAIQNVVVSELNKIAIIHLYANGFEGEDLQNFSLLLSNPSTIAQQQKLELWRTKFDIASGAPDGFVSKKFIRSEIFGLNDEQSKDIDKQRIDEKIVNDIVDSSTYETDGGDADSDEDDDMDFGDIDIESSFDDIDDDDGGDLEVASETPPEEEDDDIQLLISSDDKSDNESYPLKNKSNGQPIKAKEKLSAIERGKYNRSRHRTHGPSKTHMPDFKKIVNHESESDSLSDPFDSSWIRSFTSNPFGETVKYDQTPLSGDARSAIAGFSKRFSVSRSKNSLLKESSEAGELFISADDDDE